MSEHTKEPWKLCTHGLKNSAAGDTFGYHISADDGTEEGRLIVWEQITEAEGRRIVACVNLLEGHKTKDIEGKTLEQYVSEQAFLSGMTVSDGLNIGLKGLACQMLASSFAGQFKGNGARNYLEVSMAHPEIGEFTVTIQRKEGKTPRQFRIEVEQQRDSLLSQLKAVNELFESGDWSVLRGDGRMTLPYEQAEKVAEDVEKLVQENEA